MQRAAERVAPLGWQRVVDSENTTPTTRLGVAWNFNG